MGRRGLAKHMPRHDEAQVREAQRLAGLPGMDGIVLVDHGASLEPRVQ
jgi:hypothetical protein